jgi:hypothetical protein
VIVNHKKIGVRAAAWAAAAVIIAHALVVSKGIYDPRGLVWLAGGILLAWTGLFMGEGRRGWAWPTCLAGLAWETVQLAHPLNDAPVPGKFVFIALPALALCAAGALLIRRLVPLLLACHFLVGVWLLQLSPSPHIDVYEVIKDSCQAFSRGENPYAIDFPDLYANRPDWEKAFYSAGIVQNGRVKFGYPYMPLNFTVAYAGHVLGGDFRLGNLAAITLSGGLLAYARRNRLAVAGAALLLLTPVNYYVVERGWSEPAVVLFLAATVFCAARASPLLPWVFGLLMASKQHMFLAAPAALLLIPARRDWRNLVRFSIKAVIAAAMVTLPLALWNFHAFWHSAFAVQLNNPFRYDSLNFAAAWAKAGHAPPSSLLAFAIALAAAAAAVWRAPRSPAGFAAAVAVIYLALFAFAKQAFCNYYFFSIGALCSAVAADDGA